LCKYLGNISEKLDPDYVFSIHSFTPNYEGQIRRAEVCIATSLSEEFASKVFSISRKYKI